MDKALESLVSQYSISDPDDYENALKEIVQYLALLGLWRAKFFEHVAFYGGTALRLFYGLRRFSEDMDFSLLEKSSDFNLSVYREAIKKELEGFGFQMSVSEKEKGTESQIESAFIKGNTIRNLLAISIPESYTAKIQKNKQLKVKLEVDVDPPGNAEYDVETLLTPIPFQVKLFSKPDLFAGKLHAVICRQWKTRVKGRDLYDFLWYLGNNIPCRLKHLQSRMVQTGHWSADRELSHDDVLEMLKTRFKSINFKAAKEDVAPFLKDLHELDLWSMEFFLAATNRLRTVF
jgi:predicted nucleotidyltransferase component of viral defense system